MSNKECVFHPPIHISPWGAENSTVESETNPEMTGKQEQAFTACTFTVWRKCGQGLNEDSMECRGHSAGSNYFSPEHQQISYRTLFLNMSHLIYRVPSYPSQKEDANEQNIRERQGVNGLRDCSSYTPGVGPAHTAQGGARA